MTKYDFVLFSGQHKDFLEKLQELGLVDITVTGWEASDAERNLMQNIEQHKKALSFCAELKVENPDQVQNAKPFATGGEAVMECMEKIKSVEALTAQKQRAEKELVELQIWGEFDAESLDKLTEKGVSIHYFIAYTKEFNKHADQWREKFIVEAIGEEQGMTYFVVVAEGDIPVEINAQEIKAPTMTSQQKGVQIEQINKELDQLRTELYRCAKSVELIADDCAKLQEDLQLSRVASTSKIDADGTLVILEGWATRDTADKVEQMLEQYPNMIYMTSKPTPEDDTPVQLKNNSFSRLFEFIGNFYALPKYGTMDLTPYFGPFYMLFFGFCLADSGYGLILLLGGLFLLLKGGEKLKSVAKLTMLCATATIVFGFWAGSVFGISLADKSAFADMKTFFLNPDKMFTLAIGVGIFQILFGMTLKVIATTQQFGFKYSLATIGWMITILSGLGAFLLPDLGITGFSTNSVAFKICIGIGLGMMFLLNNPNRNPLLNIGPGLWNTYNDVTGLLSDVLSYIRLFAIGLSGGILALVFNDLAFGLSPDIPVVREIVIVLILFVGHGINLFMSSLSSFVHPMRLTFVEFYKNSGFEAGQRAFTPLKKENK